MGTRTSIEWTTHTFNPWWGCVEVSPGCAKCYARDFDRRTHGASKHVGKDGETREPHWGKDAPRRFFGEKHWRAPLAWDRAAERAMNAAERGQAGGASGCLPHRPRVFCASMADVFEDRPDLVEPRARLFRLIEATPNLDWLLLTKRPENVARMAPELHEEVGDTRRRLPDNVWLGTTCEDQQRADERIPHLLGVPAAVRFLSVEPMLGPVDLMPYIAEYDATANGLGEPGEYVALPPSARGIAWVIVGGESGAGARPFDVAWARDVVEQCRVARVACFVKQLGAHPSEHETRAAGGKWVPMVEGSPIHDPKGGDPAEWPEDLRVRQFPKGGAA